MTKKRLAIKFKAAPLPKFELKKWRLLPAATYAVRNGEAEHSVNVRPVASGEYMVLVVNGTIADHQHGTQKFHADVLDAMAVAEKLIGPEGRWHLTSFLEYASEDRGFALIATIHAMGGEATLSSIATPTGPIIDKKTARSKVDAVLANHAHDVTHHKSVLAAMRAMPAAMRRVAKTARCACTEIAKPKKKRAKR